MRQWVPELAGLPDKVRVGRTMSSTRTWEDYVKMKNVGYTNNAGKFEMFMMIVP